MAEDRTPTQRRKLARARTVVGPALEVAAYRSGKGRIRPTWMLLFLGLGYVQAFFTAAFIFGSYLISGALLVLLVYYSVRPLRGVAVSPSGVLVMQESLANGEPNKLLFVAPPDALGSSDEHHSGRRHVRVQVGSESIRLKRSDYDSLVVANRSLITTSESGAQPPPTDSTPAGWLPDPSSRYQFRYWDGRAWTERVSHDGIVYSDSGS